MTDSKALISWHFVTFLSHLLFFCVRSEGYQQLTKVILFLTIEVTEAADKKQKNQKQILLSFLKRLEIDGPRTDLPYD